MTAKAFVTGLREVDAMFAGLENKYRKEVVRKATRDVAKVVMTGIQSAHVNITGTYDRSMAVRTARKKDGSPLRSRHRMGHAVVARTEKFQSYEDAYAGLLEYGRPASSSSGAAPAFHVMRDTARQFRAFARGLFLTATRQWLPKVKAKRAARIAQGKK